MRHGDHHVFRRDEVENVQVFFAVADLGTTLVAEFGLHTDQLLADHLQQAVGIFQDVDQPGDHFQQLLVLVGQAVLPSPVRRCSRISRICVAWISVSW